jgi:hypothetical protein
MGLVAVTWLDDDGADYYADCGGAHQADGFAGGQWENEGAGAESFDLALLADPAADAADAAAL